MGLVQVATNTVTSAVASVTLTGIDSDDVYMVAFNNVKPSGDPVVLYGRLTKTDGSGGGTTQSDAEYDYAYRGLYSDTSFSNGASANTTQWAWGWNGTDTGESSQGTMYLYNFNSSSEYSFQTSDTVNVNHSANTRGFAEGGVHTVASASNGITFLYHSGNITAGTFTLYKVT